MFDFDTYTVLSVTLLLILTALAQHSRFAAISTVIIAASYPWIFQSSFLWYYPEESARSYETWGWEVLIGVLFLFTGGWTHTTKSGKRDNRYKLNPRKRGLTHIGKQYLLGALLIMILAVVADYAVDLLRSHGYLGGTL